MDLGLTNQVAIITGGASGIGLATVKLLLAEGVRVAIWDHRSDVDSYCKSLGTADRVLGVTADITNAESLDKAHTRTVEHFGSYQHVIHCAAIGSGKFGFPFTNLSPEDWLRVIEVDVIGMVRVAHQCTPLLREAGQGTFTFLGSVAGQIGSQTDPPYSAAKAANINFAQCMARDLASHGVRVNTVNPGMVQTPLNRSVWQAWYNQTPETERLSYEQWAGEKVKRVVPLGQWQTPEDIANMIAFLISDRARNVTGQTINVDGGFVMHW